jgi:predicted AAA+ superfamily ATPase
MEYVPRLLEHELELELQALGGVLVEGVMGCGKSELCRQIAKRVINLEIDDSARELVGSDASLLLDGPYPTLFDEWQSAPKIWNQIRNDIDTNRAKARYLLTGSAAPKQDQTRHPGVGRIGRLRLRPFTLQESGVSDGTISLRALSSGTQLADSRSQRIAGITPAIHSILRGGFPEQLRATVDQAQRAMRNYVRQIPARGFEALIERPRSPLTTEAILLTLARLLGSELKYASVTRDVVASGVSADPGTVASYIDLLERAFVVERVPAWFGHLRSKVRVSQTDKYYFADPSLAAAVLQADESSLIGDLETTGFLFENLVFRDLVVITEALGGRLFHYRDKNNLEVDFILRLKDGAIAPIEVKLGTNRVPEAINNLSKFEKKLDLTGTRLAFKAVITTGEYSYQDKETGTWVVSIHHLGI